MLQKKTQQYNSYYNDLNEDGKFIVKDLEMRHPAMDVRVLVVLLFRRFIQNYLMVVLTRRGTYNQESKHKFEAALRLKLDGLIVDFIILLTIEGSFIFGNMTPHSADRKGLPVQKHRCSA
jgi:hypothetical protein